MDTAIMYLKVFITGGSLCLIGQLLIDRTGLTPAKILTLYVVAGLVLSAVGVYEPLAEFAGAGAAVPLTGFGNAIAKGVRKAVEEKGIIGAFTGPLCAASAGIGAAVFFGLITAALFRAKDKK